MPKCEVAHPNLSLDELLKIVSIEDFFNISTGLPLVLDMVDDLLNLSLGLTYDYVEEIEAEAIDKVVKNNVPLNILKLLFLNLNLRRR
jgi:hypothetical protein